MKDDKRSAKKKKNLTQSGTLNPNAEKVTDELFQDEGFFDQFDLLQVKYEMLRRVEKDNQTISNAAKTFGFSRRHFYEIQKQYVTGGIFGLMPEKRGPKSAHKIDDAVMKFILESIDGNSTLKAHALSVLVEKQFQLKVHPRSIERAITRKKKEK